MLASPPWISEVNIKVEKSKVTPITLELLILKKLERKINRIKERTTQHPNKPQFS